MQAVMVFDPYWRICEVGGVPDSRFRESGEVMGEWYTEVYALSTVIFRIRLACSNRPGACRSGQTQQRFSDGFGT